MSYHPESVISALAEKACELRLDVLRMLSAAGSDRPGGSLSSGTCHCSPLPSHEDRSCLTAMARARSVHSVEGTRLSSAVCRSGTRWVLPCRGAGYSETDDSRLQGYPDRMKTPGVDMTSGSLGHGLSIGVGLTLAARAKDACHRTYVLLGDGEIQAGVVWAGAMAAGKYGLGQLTSHPGLQRCSARRSRARDHAAGIGDRQVAELQLARDRD